MISVGDLLPNIALYTIKENAVDTINIHDIFQRKRGILFAVPGAFTHTCSTQHVPGFIKYRSRLKHAGIETVVCLSVNDPFVMHAWGDKLGIDGMLMMLSDGNGDFTSAVGMTFDLTSNGFGIRSRRYAMLIDDNYVVHLDVDEIGAGCTVSSAEHFLNLLDNKV